MELIKDRLTRLFRDYSRFGIRPSHLIIAVMVVAGVVVNLFFAHGWTVWPFVLAFGILTFINEAADRSGQGIPPFQAYAFLFGVVGFWILFVVILSSINPLICILGLAIVVYRAAQAFIKQRERDRLIASRLSGGRCIHCGELYDPNVMLCESCGDEPNPEAATHRRIAEIYRTPEEMARSRAMLTRGLASATSSSKESALLARRRSGKKMTPPSPLPKAAKLGGSGGSSKKNRG